MRPLITLMAMLRIVASLYWNTQAACQNYSISLPSCNKSDIRLSADSRLTAGKQAMFGMERSAAYNAALL
jgi:hypothetical protein